MSRRKKEQLTVVYLLVLAPFGVGLVLSAIGLLCRLGAPDVPSYMVRVATPF